MQNAPIRTSYNGLAKSDSTSPSGMRIAAFAASNRSRMRIPIASSPGPSRFSILGSSARHRARWSAATKASAVGTSTMSTPRGELLHSPAVAVRVAEEYEADVVERFPALTQRIRVAAHHLDLANLDTAIDELRVRFGDVRDD